jgi:toxin-antitoxin system PIN domain toxin
MLLPDVNVLIYAHRIDAVDHGRYRDWLQGVADGEGAYAMSELVLSGFLRLMTSPRLFPHDSSSTAEALHMAAQLRDRPNCRPLTPGPRHWAIFIRLCEQAGTRGNLVADAYHAALAIEHGCEWVTTDRDFSRFAGLRWSHPLDG